MAFLDPIFNPVLLPLVDWNPFWAIVILSLIITLLITLAYKYFTNQKEMKRLKEEQKEYRQRSKKIQDNKEEMMRLQKEMVQKNMEYMKLSFRAMLITFLPIVLIFGWMNAHLAYEPIYPGETYSVSALVKEEIKGTMELLVDEGTTVKSEAVQQAGTDKAVKLPEGFFSQEELPATTWIMFSTLGEHNFSIKYDDKEFTHGALISEQVRYGPPAMIVEHSDIVQLQVNYNRLMPLGSFSLFGWKPGWLGLYIILSFAFSIALRKWLKIY